MGSLFFGLCTITRSTGFLLTAVPLFYLGHKLFRNLFGLTEFGRKQREGLVSNVTGIVVNFIAGIKYTFTIFSVILMICTPIFVISSWKPYDMYCLSRLDTYYEVPDWCYEKIPYIYSYI